VCNEALKTTSPLIMVVCIRHVLWILCTGRYSSISGCRFKVHSARGNAMVLFKSVSENGSEDRTATQESPQLERVQKKGLAWLKKGATWRARAVPVLQGRTSFGQSIRRRPDGTRASGFSVRAKFQSEIKNKYDTSFAARRKVIPPPK
jgi:hypothetical protein